MKRFFVRLANMLAIVTFAVGFVACGEDDPPAVEVSSVAVAPTTLALEVGDKQTLTATVEPQNATDKTVTWSSNAPTVAEVNASTGEVTAKAIGAATVTATAANGKKAKCEVTVAAKVIAVTSVAVTPATLDLKVDETATLTVTIAPEDATDKTVTWSSNAPDTVEVDVSTGEVTAKAIGEATITATTANGKTATCTVTVSAIEVTDVTLSSATLNLFEGDKHTLTATVVPENATDKTVTWSSNDSGIAEVDVSTGEVTAKAGGNATITATTANGKTATCDVSVTPLLSKSGWSLGRYMYIVTAGSMNIANGNYNDYWDGSVVGQTSLGVPYNITLIDMGSSRTISRIDIHRGQNVKRVQWSVRSSISITKEDWEPLGGDGEYQDNDYERNKVLSIDANAGGNVSGRYLMILVATAFGDNAFQLAEIDVYGN